MGGFGSGNNHGQNMYTAFAAWRERYGPDEPYPLKHANGEVEWVMELPKKRVGRQQRKRRSDRGGTHRKQGEKKPYRSPYNEEAAPLTWQQHQDDLYRTQVEIEKFEAIEHRKEHENDPVNVERRKRIQREKNKRHYNKVIARDRKLKLPEDRRCKLCSQHKSTSKQWIVLLFLDGEHAVCRSCYDLVRVRMFENNVENTRTYFKQVSYATLQAMHETHTS